MGKETEKKIKRKGGGKIKGEDIIVLKYKGWLIRKDAYNYILHHVNDKKMNHAVYLSSLSQALKALHERLLLSKMANNGYDSSMMALKKAIDETHEEFTELLTPSLIQQLRRIKEDERNEGN